MMGMNFYWVTEARSPCPHCGRPYDSERKHIGKSSFGWYFALHIYPDEGINDLPDWNDRWKTGGWIEDEYGEKITVPDMVLTIACRWGAHQSKGQDAHWFDENRAMPASFGLAVPRMVRLGTGTYFLQIGDEDSW